MREMHTHARTSRAATHLANAHFALQFSSNLLVGWGQALAMTTPGRVKLDQVVLASWRRRLGGVSRVGGRLSFVAGGRDGMCAAREGERVALTLVVASKLASVSTTTSLSSGLIALGAALTGVGLPVS